MNAIPFDDVPMTRYLGDYRKMYRSARRMFAKRLMGVQSGCVASFGMPSNVEDKENGGDEDSDQVMKEMCVLALLCGVMKNDGQAAFSHLKSTPPCAETILMEEPDMVNALNDVCAMLGKDGEGLDVRCRSDWGR